MTKFFTLIFCLCFSLVALAGTYQASCTNSSAIVVPSNTARKRVLVRNMTATAVTATLCYDVTCTTTTGFPLVQNAEFETIFTRGNITCITASGTATLAIVEE